jgi:alpha-mannosidase
MVADRVVVTAADSVIGEITSRGRLVDGQGRLLAAFQQRMRVARESRVLQLEIELAPAQLPEGDPWRCYYAARFAWPDETAQLWRSVGMARVKSQAARFDALYFVEVASGSRQISILAGGLAFHQRSGARMLDTLLIVPGELARTFRLGIGVDLTHPLPAALELIAPQQPLCMPVSCPRCGPAGWLLHVDAKNVVVTHLEPLVDTRASAVTTLRTHKNVRATCEQGEKNEVEPPQICGFRLRLLETEGHAGRICIRSFRDIRSARRTDLGGQLLEELPLEGGRVMLGMGKHEWVQIKAKWR